MPGPLIESDIKIKDPFHLFQKWYDEAKISTCCSMPNTFCLTTASEEGRPSGRMMTLSEFSKFGFVFLTSATSRKGKDMSQNKKVTITFHWSPFLRMITIDGDIEECPYSVAEENFKNRKIEAKVWANLCNQGSSVPSRKYLENKGAELRKKYSDNLPKPENWKAFILKPRKFIFYQGNEHQVIQDKIFFFRPKPGADKKESACQGENGWMYHRIQ